MSETAVKVRPAAPAEAETSDTETGRAAASGGPGDGRPQRPRRPAPRLTRNPGEKFVVPEDGGDPHGWYGRLAACFGSDDEQVGLHFLRALERTLTEPDADDPGAVNALVAACAALEPEDALDGLMGAQLAALHAIAMANFSIAALLSDRQVCVLRDGRGLYDPVPARTLAGVRCVRTFALNRETFERMRAARRKGGR